MDLKVIPFIFPSVFLECHVISIFLEGMCQTASYFTKVTLCQYGRIIFPDSNSPLLIIIKKNRLIESRGKQILRLQGVRQALIIACSHQIKREVMYRSFFFFFQGTTSLIFNLSACVAAVAVPRATAVPASQPSATADDRQREVTDTLDGPSS